MSIRFLILSDIHERKTGLRNIISSVRDIGGIDYVLVAGDITHFSGRDRAFAILADIIEELGKPVLFVPGNCDDPSLLSVEEYLDSQIIGIHNRRYCIDKYVLFGIGGSNITPFNTLIEWSEEDLRSFIEKVKDVSRENLIVVTHAPIYGVMDEINGEHVGSKVLREFLDKHGAILWITGHLHEYSACTIVNKCLVVNPGPAMKSYYAIAELGDSSVSVNVRNAYVNKTLRSCSI
ncbi:MAG: metallophosphoesterase [Thermoprotei archaeon]